MAILYWHCKGSTVVDDDGRCILCGRIIHVTVIKCGARNVSTTTFTLASPTNGKRARYAATAARSKILSLR